MPVYEYRCRQCQKVFEYQQRMADAAKTTCEECAGDLERLISRSSFSFKGGGWYKDLYSSSKPGDAPKADGADKPAPAASNANTTSTESSPASSGSSSSGSSTGSSSGSSGGGGGSSSSTAAAGPAK